MASFQRIDAITLTTYGFALTLEDGSNYDVRRDRVNRPRNTQINPVQQRVINPAPILSENQPVINSPARRVRSSPQSPEEFNLCDFTQFKVGNLVTYSRNLGRYASNYGAIYKIVSLGNDPSNPNTFLTIQKVMHEYLNEDGPNATNQYRGSIVRDGEIIKIKRRSARLSDAYYVDGILQFFTENNVKLHSAFAWKNAKRNV